MHQSGEHRNGIWTAPSCIALIGVGANLPGLDDRSPLDSCRHAVAMLNSIPGLRLIGLSRWFESAPVPPSGQPDYVNAVAALLVDSDSAADPGTLLAHLMAVETACARQRSAPNAARTMDLDLIAMGDLVRSAPDPILPHPRAHLRAFVLAPLIDVAPNWLHPVLCLTPAAMFRALPPQAIRAL